jgi:MoaA/NifB/PqqE/SkfB family radical SAM enzyme
LPIKQLINALVRRRAWLFGRMNARRALNLASAAKDFALGRETLSALPSFVKIDISPLCNLRCTACVHADPSGNPTLERQVFDPKHKMTLAQFGRIIEQIRGKTSAVSLYYLGDPMVHPDLDSMCRLAADAGLQVHISTNLSFGLKDDRIRSMVQSGLSHLTVCIDGLSQEKYERTRVGGNIGRVVHNLECISRVRRELGQHDPLIEVQYIMFQHNTDEVEQARQMCKDFGIDEFVTFWGDLHNWTSCDPANFDVRGPRPRKCFPRCHWPYFTTVIKWNGDVIPCCTYRQGMQYAPGADARVFGNVFEKDLREIWNSPDYQHARRMAADPMRSNQEPALKSHFCDACQVLFETTRYEKAQRADAVRFEEVFMLNEKGRPVRKAASGERLGTSNRPSKEREGT